MKIYTSYPKTPAERDLFASLTEGEEAWIARGAPHAAEDEAAFLGAEVAFGHFDPALLPRAKALRWIQLPSAGIDKYTGFDWAGFGGRVVCTNAGDIYAEPIVQTALAGILALYRGIDRLVLLQARRDWQKPAVQYTWRVLGKAHVLLMGAGAMGRRMRELLQPFGCTFTAFGRTSGDIHTPEELDRALPLADIVCGALPDTPATRGLLGPARIARLKPGAVFVNLGRGSLVDEPALVAALQAGRLGGAVLDVTAREPIPAEDPLWACPRTILTQHTSPGTPDMALKPIALFGENLGRYRAGQPLKNVIDWTRGY